MDEIWKPVVGLEGQYEVSNLGRARSLDRIENGPRRRARKGRILKPGIRNGYPCLFLPSGGGQRKYNIHRLIAAAFIGSPPDGAVVDHINGVKQDNRLENLRYTSISENTLNTRKVWSKSGIRGVHVNPCSKSKPWVARISWRGERVFLGAFATPEAALSAIDAFKTLN